MKLLLMLVAILAAQPSTLLGINLRFVDSSEYPQVDVIMTVVDREQVAPVRGLTVNDFFATVDTGDTITIASVQEVSRPRRIALVVDITASIAPGELTNQIAALRALINQLTPNDQLALVVFDEGARVLSPMTSDFESVIDQLGTVTLSEEVSGNAYWDALYQAVELVPPSDMDRRGAVVVLTDVATGDGSGVRTEGEVITLATERDTEIFGLYFEHEGDGLPDNPPELPPELTISAEATGGSVVGVAGNQGADDNYTDDDALPTMMQVVYELLNHEYRITLNSTIPPDGTDYRFQIGLTYEDIPRPPIAGRFTAGEEALSLSFPNAANVVSLPYTLPIEIDTSASIDSIGVEATDAEGNAVNVPEATTTGLTLTDLEAGTYTFVVSVTDGAGNIAEERISLEVQATLAINLVGGVPDELAADEELELAVAINLADSIQEVRLLIDGEVERIDDLPPFDRVEFTWEPPAEGEYRIEVVAVDDVGTTVSLEDMLTVVPGSDGAALSPIWIVMGAVAALSVAGGVGFFVWRRRGAGAPIAIDPTRQATANILRLEDQHGNVWRLMEGENSIGRQSTNMIQLKDDSVSRAHAVIIVAGRKVIYRDLETASHPSEVNGVLIDDEIELKTGDKLRIGSTILQLLR